MSKRHAALPLAGFACVLALQVCTNGSEKMPLPSIFFQAKTIAIINDTDESYVLGRASDELRKWGRYQIVPNPHDADLVLVLAMREDLVGVEPNASTDSYTTIYGNGNVTNQKSTTVACFDSRTGRKVWSETRAWGSEFGNAVVALIKDLRKQVEKAEKEMAKP